MPSAPPVLRRPVALELRARVEDDRREAERRIDKARREASPTRRLYGTARWQALRAEQLSRQPLCVMCQEIDRVTEANVVDHVEPHRGDEAKFWHGPFQSLCRPCHDRHKQRQERGRG